MTQDKSFYRRMIKIALPITLQSLLQATLVLIDEIMIGQMGSDSIAGIGLSSKFISLFSVTVSAVITVASILIAQYIGNKNKEGVNDSFNFNLYASLGITILFMVSSIIIPSSIMSIYTNDSNTINIAAKYLRVTSVGFLPMTLTLMCSAYLRNIGYAKIPMYASIASVFSDIILNYGLIFGNFGLPKLEVVGAALATTIARFVEFAIVFVVFERIKRKSEYTLWITFKFTKPFIMNVFKILLPILMCEFLWSFGENVYAVIYGRIGTEQCAAMTLTYPVQNFMIGLLSGISSAAGIMIGKLLGADEEEKAYEESKEFVRITIIMSLIISLIIFAFGRFYVKLYNVPLETMQITVYILNAYALVFIAKVINMVLGGGVLRSGGKTKYIMLIDIVGTWIIGVPAGLVTSFILELPIYWVYFILSLEEYVRVILEVKLFRSRKWMNNVANI
ncbi:MAG: MATE family efflux transporter [Clostridium sp.]|nr:MATE family efflux transporter [Clostridium sp.]